VLRVIVLLEGEPSPHSEVVSALEQVFIQDVSVLAPFILPSILTGLPVPAAEKHPHSMILPPPYFTVLGRYWHIDERCLVSSRHDTWHSGRELNLDFIEPGNLVSHGLGVI
jgi:hypothetical protein